MDRLLQPDGRDGLSRSMLMAARRSEMSGNLQREYDTWERSNPVWAKRRTGPEAAAALGYPDFDDGTSRSEMIRTRRLQQREVAYRSSGFSEQLQKTLTSHDPDAIVTSISRVTSNPSTTYVAEPTIKCRSQLRNERRAENVATLDMQTERNEREGKPGAEERVQRRIDQAIVYLQGASEAGSKSRAALLEARRKERADKALADYEAFKPQQPPRYAEQPDPFWKLDKQQQKVQQQRQAEVEASVQPSLPPVGEPTFTESLPIVSARANSTLPNGSVSAEVLSNQRKWWVKPEHYPKVAPAEPAGPEPFKLTADDRSFLHRKLSAGPKKEQRGYPPDARAISEKITSLPPPSLAEAVERKAFRQYSGATFKFMPSEPREQLPGSSDTNADGYEFTQPLYSSFTADRTFQAPKLPTRPAERLQPAPRERRQPAAQAQAQAQAPQNEVRFGNTGPAKMMAPPQKNRVEAAAR